jgi:hypothetical protein
MLKTTSDFSATAFGESAHAAPFAISFAAFSLLRVKTVAPKPLLIR